MLLLKIVVLMKVTVSHWSEERASRGDVVAGRLEGTVPRRRVLLAGCSEWSETA
jgi:hypothetical protein